jgi:hypothetical protein
LGDGMNKYKTEIETSRITDGLMDSKILWICDIRWNDFNNKPIRKVVPSKVLVRANSETKKRIYYSESHFVALNKDNKPLKSKVIAVFDNTGYRSFRGTPLRAFTDQRECILAFSDMCCRIKDDLSIYKKQCISRITTMEKEVHEMSTDFLIKLNDI